ncbi:hypothetical protein ACKVMT_16665 [Halobacteriales archaeon Cl-PHB]
MATLVTRDGKSREFAEIWITDGGRYLCYADGYRENGADVSLVVPATTVNRVEPDEGVESETFGIKAQVSRGRHVGPQPNVVPTGNDYARRVFEEVRVR